MTLQQLLLVVLVIGLTTAAFVVDCVPDLGLRTPPAVCTSSNKCTDLLLTYAYRGIKEIATPESPPRSCTGLFEGKYYSDGSPKEVVLEDKTDTSSPSTRHYCAHVPVSSNKIALVVYFHGSGGSATGAYRDGWRHYAENGIPGVFGGKPFALVGAQALNRHWPPSGALAGGEDGTKFDFMFRNFTLNDDVRYVDAIIDLMVKSHNVDPSRIYVSGYSNGCYFANMYASIRSGSTQSGSWGSITGKTGGGNTIAAASSFSGASPWIRPPECPYAVPPRSTIPLQILVYACDLVVCPHTTAYRNILATQGSLNASVIVLADDGWTMLPDSQCEYSPQGCTTTQRMTNHGNYPHRRIPLMAAFMDQNHGSGKTPSETQQPLPQTAQPDPSSNSNTPEPSHSGMECSSALKLLWFVVVLIVC